MRRGIAARHRSGGRILRPEADADGAAGSQRPGDAHHVHRRSSRHLPSLCSRVPTDGTASRGGASRFPRARSDRLPPLRWRPRFRRVPVRPCAHRDRAGLPPAPTVVQPRGGGDRGHRDPQLPGHHPGLGHRFSRLGRGVLPARRTRMSGDAVGAASRRLVDRCGGSVHAFGVGAGVVGAARHRDGAGLLAHTAQARSRRRYGATFR